MKNLYEGMANGYLDSIQYGINGIKRFGGKVVNNLGPKEEQIIKLMNVLNKVDTILIGAGAGLSTAAGFTYSGERFDKYFFDFKKRYGIKDMYSGGFYPYSDKEIFWAYWARYIYINRYMDPPKSVYKDLYELVKDKDYFVITTNVDHCFQKAGFDKKRLFYTQGDYGLFQSENPNIQKTYANEEWVYKAMSAQGFIKNEEGLFEVPEDKKILMHIPTELIPRCPDDGSYMTTNLRADNNFVEDAGWHKASMAYSDFLRRHNNTEMLLLELGVGNNTPVIIKYPFLSMANERENVIYACINYQEAYVPIEIKNRSICINDDIANVFDKLKSKDEML